MKIDFKNSMNKLEDFDNFVGKLFIKIIEYTFVIYCIISFFKYLIEKL